MRTTYLAHHGIKGMKWGIRRYQNANGTLTAGKKRKNQDSTSSKQSYRVVDSKYVASNLLSDAVDIIGSRYVASALKSFGSTKLSLLGDVISIAGTASGLTGMGLTFVEAYKGKTIRHLIDEKKGKV